MHQIVTLTPEQHLALHGLKELIKPASVFELPLLDELVNARLVRQLSGDRVAISGNGLDYLLTHELPRIGAADESVVELPSAAPELTNPRNSTTAFGLKTLAQIVAQGIVPSKSVHPPTRAVLLRTGLIAKTPQGDLVATSEGRAVVASDTPPVGRSQVASGVRPYAPSTNGHAKSEPLPVESPHSADAIGDAVPGGETGFLDPDLTRFDDGGQYSQGTEPVDDISPIAPLDEAVDDYIAAHDGSDCATCDGCFKSRFIDYLVEHSPHVRTILASYERWEQRRADLIAAQDDLSTMTEPLREVGSSQS
jgi:hypothetical protein